MASAPAVLRLEFLVPHPRHAEFQRLVEGMGSAATRAHGATGVDAAATGRTGEDERWSVNVLFESEQALARWRGSSDAAKWRARLEGVASEQPLIRVRKGVEIWFSPASAYADPPPGWKLALLSIVGIYPTTLVLNQLLAPLERSAPEWAIALVSVSILSALVTWLIMPALTRLFHGWLYPAAQADRVT
ncbi:hypothetical protein PQ455_05315 [Sphingomonas naphthae]|uniref:Antibiotic biosynthesis monooxygenase n=1 Tax=Sphingomonas naphthae TaxID=1813468 RepID=A0ABY7TS17_9SPHN|nr:hypothetical protein [Sphingomonas naphthae]WCT74649.1 hypothetical protein PQ455_05315 [Sphingomonas naphthae]